MTRDNRIGEITNIATSIENKYTTKDEIKKLYSDYSSLLRISQGKEIDFLKTGFRWQLSKGLRKHIKQLPYFLLYNYPAKMKTYRKLVDTNKNIENKDEKLKLNAYHSPSPMNELCDYICTWEKKNIMWSNSTEDLVDTRCLIVNNDLVLNDRKIIKTVRRYINEYADEIRNHINLNGDVKTNSESKFNVNEIVNRYKRNILRDVNTDEETIANYVIKTSYSSISISKSLAWSAYGDYIIKNLKENSNPKRNISIVEVPYKTNDSFEYLGKYYEFRINYENKTQ